MVWEILFWTAVAIVVRLDLEILEGILRPPPTSKSSLSARACSVALFVFCLGSLVTAVALNSWWPLLVGVVTFLVWLMVFQLSKHAKAESFNTAFSGEGREAVRGSPPSSSGIKRSPQAKGPTAGFGGRQEEPKPVKSSSAGMAETNTCGPGGNYARQEEPEQFELTSAGPSLGYTPATSRRETENYSHILGHSFFGRETSRDVGGPLSISLGDLGSHVTRTRDVPGGTVDPVHFCVTSPLAMAAGSKCVVDVWAYLEAQHDRVIERAKQEAGGVRIQIKTQGPVKVARGTTVTVRLRIEDMKIKPAKKPILWIGEIGNASFQVNVPGSIKQGPHSGSATILIDGIPVAKVWFIVNVGAQTDPTLAIAERETRYNSAFASYASEDRKVVIERIIGMKKAAPNLDVFVDVANLRSGEHWQEKLEREILKREVMYLFWSVAASRSKWVDWEWRTALRERGLDFIDPCPLDPPDKAPPPTELEPLHFYECLLPHRG